MKQIMLNGIWKMRATDETIFHDAQVPGSVYSAYLADGTMDDPFWRDNELKAFDLLKKDYEFMRDFTVSEDFLRHPRVFLRCDGLDTLAHVFLNGQKIADADNMHIRWLWDIKAILHAGENQLRIVFDSPIVAALSEHAKRPCKFDADATAGSQHIRKAHCMYGWDWGPRLPDAGIWRDISLVAADEALLDSVQVLQQHDAGRVTLTIIPELLLGDFCQYKAKLTHPDGTVQQIEFESKADLDVTNPLLWWPNGYGDQPLYTLKIEAWKNGVLQDEKTMRIGLRTLSISREKDEWSEEFCHVVNGVKVFAMGGDYIPEDNILSRVTPERTRRLLEDAKLANFNTIRVWGGGYYPHDDFYDTCDELGLMVWQDCMFACNFYDLTPAFETSIRTEVEQNVRRIRHHACLAILCGNNEIEDFHYWHVVSEFGSGSWNPNESRPGLHADYIKMFEYIISGICTSLAPQIFYWSSSPSSGGGFDNPNDENRGDTHYWMVWHGLKPFSDYRNHYFRYASEFGFQSFPGLKTVESFTLPEDRNIFSAIMERHQRNSSANGKIMSYLSQTYRYPSSFDHLLYASQLMQADAIRFGVEHWRRNRGRCMGAIYWQLNDIWPVASWASIDYFGRWKALHYYAKRFFAPIMISCEEEGSHTLDESINTLRDQPIPMTARLNVANETMHDVKGLVRWSLRTPDGKIVKKGQKTVTVPSLASLNLSKLDFTDATKLHVYYLSYAFIVDGKIISSGSNTFCPPKHYEWCDPHLTVRADGNDIIVSAKAYASGIRIESDDPDLLLSDNYFTMNPGQIHVTCLRGSTTGLRVSSVYDIDK